MENKYGEWQAGAAEETKKKVLMTISAINEDADKELTLTELEKLNYCWDILRDMKQIECHAKKIECMEYQMEHGHKTPEAIWGIAAQLAENRLHSNGNGNSSSNSDSSSCK